MKTLYLTGSIILTVMILILAFENFTAKCGGLHFLFFPLSENPTILTLGIAVLGVITGMMYHAFLNKAFAEPEEKEEDVF